jgi:hypothetical protein
MVDGNLPSTNSAQRVKLSRTASSRSCNGAMIGASEKPVRSKLMAAAMPGPKTGMILIGGFRGLLGRPQSRSVAAFSAICITPSVVVHVTVENSASGVNSHALPTNKPSPTEEES